MLETVLGIDIGTSSTKAVVAALDGRILARTEHAHAVRYPRPGWAEHDAERTWWADVVAVCDALRLQLGSVRAVGVSGIGPCLLPCDSRARPLRPAILYGIDSRASAEIEAIEERLGAENVVRRAGSSLSSQAVGPKLLWLRRNEPETWGRMAAWFMASSFVAARLTGEYVLDRHSASQCDPLYDFEAGCWADDWIAELLGPIAMPRLVAPAEVVGEVSDRASADLGIPAGTPVVAGTIDAWAEAFSAGVRRPGDLMLMYGSTAFLIEVVAAARPAPPLWLTEGVEDGLRTLAAGMSTTGTLSEWVRSLTGSNPWKELIAAAEALPAGADGLLMLPYFAGERTPIYDPQARGVVAGLSLHHRPGHLLRATYEGVALGIRQILELFAGAGQPASRRVAVGGGTKSKLWLQITADATEAPLLLPRETIGASYGDALLAAIGAGLVPPETDWSVIDEVIEPDPAKAPVYRSLAPLFADLYRDTRGTVHELGRIAEPREQREASGAVSVR